MKICTKCKETKPLSDGDFIEMAWAYELARSRSKATGIKYVVDHILPIKSSFVCGLHVPQNLQIITKSENSKKGNRLCPPIR